jgi:cyclophilin family peptidyl-prolyl cis-trans isomerase
MRTDCLSLSAVLVVAAGILSTQIGCGSGESGAPAASMEQPGEKPAEQARSAETGVADPVQIVASDASTETPASLLKENLHPEVIINTDAGDIRVQLDAEKAPLTVASFLANCVQDGFYTGTIFHYVEQGYMIVGGGYTADLQEKRIWARLKSEADNGLKNERGTLAMIRQPDDIDSAASQFFINLTDNPQLDHQADAAPEDFGYCVFGRVVEGMDVVEKIAKTPVTDKEQFSKTPVEPIAIRAVDLVR